MLAGGNIGQNSARYSSHSLLIYIIPNICMVIGQKLARMVYFYNNINANMGIETPNRFI